MQMYTHHEIGNYNLNCKLASLACRHLTSYSYRHLQLRSRPQLQLGHTTCIQLCMQRAIYSASCSYM